MTDQFLALTKLADRSFLDHEWEKEFATLYPIHFAKLKELGFIIDSSRDELSELRFENKKEAFSSRELFLMIYPTQDCNLKCWYCYESHVANSVMSEDVQKRIICNIKRQVELNTFDSLRVAFFGGEPMLNFKAVAYELAVNLKNIVSKAGKSFQTFFVTNATLIGSDEIDMLKEINPYFQITLDGNRAKHNSVRVRKDCIEPTYDSIINAIKGIIKQIYLPGNYSQPIITIRINYDNNTLATISELASDLGDIPRSAIMIHLERVWQTKHLVTDVQRKLLIETIQSLLSQGFYVSHGCFGNKRVSCPAEKMNYFIVNYDGSLFRCNGRTLTPETKEGYLGNIGEIVWNETIQSQRQGLATFENNRCLQCKMLPRCMGPCSQKLIEHKGFNSSICTIESMDISLNEYLLIEFEKRMTICGFERFTQS